MKKLSFILILMVTSILCLSSCAQDVAITGPEFSTLPNNYGKNKKEINITTISFSNYSGFITYVNAFNEHSKEYVVNVKYYLDSSKNTDSNDYNRAHNALNTDLMAGYTPDILLLNNELPVISYTNKDLFADLYTYMNDDNDFDINLYLPNVFTTLEQNGKLYEIFPSFSVTTMYMRECDAIDLQEWTISGFIEFLKQKQNLDLNNVINYYERPFLSSMIPIILLENNASEITINRSDLSALFSIAARLRSDFENINPMEVQMGMRYGDPIISSGLLSSPRDIRIWEQVYAGDDITIIGFPHSNPFDMSLRHSGISYFNPAVRLAIMVDAPEGKGAWEFIKFILNYDITDGQHLIPVNLTLIDKMMSLAKEDYWGEEYSISITLDDDDTVINIPVGNNTDEDNEKFMNLILSLNDVNRYDVVIENIISEEIDNYFSMSLTIDQVADNIEKRINLYLSEIG